MADNSIKPTGYSGPNAEPSYGPDALDNGNEIVSTVKHLKPDTETKYKNLSGEAKTAYTKWQTLGSEYDKQLEKLSQQSPELSDIVRGETPDSEVVPLVMGPRAKSVKELVRRDAEERSRDEAIRESPDAANRHFLPAAPSVPTEQQAREERLRSAQARGDALAKSEGKKAEDDLDEARTSAAERNLDATLLAKRKPSPFDGDQELENWMNQVNAPLNTGTPETETTLVPPPIVKGESAVFDPKNAGLKDAGVKDYNPIGTKYKPTYDQIRANALEAQKQRIAKYSGQPSQAPAPAALSAPVTPENTQAASAAPQVGSTPPTASQVGSTPSGPEVQTSPPPPDQSSGLSFPEAQDRKNALESREKEKNAAIAAQRVEDGYLATKRDEAAYRDTIARTAAEKAKLPMSTLFEDMSAPRRLMAGIALAVGGFSSGLNGGPNQAFEVLKTASDMDWRQKMEKISAKVQDMQQAGATADQLRAFTQQGIMHALASQSAKNIKIEAMGMKRLAPYPQAQLAFQKAMAMQKQKTAEEQAKFQAPYSNKETTTTTKGGVVTTTTGKAGSGSSTGDRLPEARKIEALHGAATNLRVAVENSSNDPAPAKYLKVIAENFQQMNVAGKLKTEGLEGRLSAGILERGGLFPGSLVEGIPTQYRDYSRKWLAHTIAGANADAGRAALSPEELNGRVLEKADDRQGLSPTENASEDRQEITSSMKVASEAGKAEERAKHEPRKVDTALYQSAVKSVKAGKEIPGQRQFITWYEGKYGKR